MLFTVEQDTLRSALDCAVKGMDMNSTLPILAGVLITTTDQGLRLETTNMEVSISQQIIAHVEEPGQVVVPCKLLSDIVSHLPNMAISFRLDNTLLNVTCDTSSYSLNTLSPQDFPQFPSYDIETRVEIPVSTLTSMVSKVAVAASTDKNHSILNGILLNITQNMIRLVTTDSIRLAVAEAKIANSVDSFEVIAPAKTLRTVISLATGYQNITVGMNATQLVFFFGDVVYITRRIEGTYPNYRKLIPTTATTTVRVKHNDLYEAMQRIKAMTATNSELRFEIVPESGLLIMTSNLPDQGSAREELSVEAEGISQKIAFNSRFIFDCIQKTDEDEDITFSMESPNKPGIFKTLGKVDFLYLVMPVRTSAF